MLVRYRTVHRRIKPPSPTGEQRAQLATWLRPFWLHAQDDLRGAERPSGPGEAPASPVLEHHDPCGFGLRAPGSERLRQTTVPCGQRIDSAEAAVAGAAFGSTLVTLYPRPDWCAGPGHARALHPED